jgi:hypothetical protein
LPGAERDRLPLESGWERFRRRRPGAARLVAFGLPGLAIAVLVLLLGLPWWTIVVTALILGVVLAVSS